MHVRKRYVPVLRRCSLHQGVRPNPQALPGVAYVVVLGSEPISPGLWVVTGQCSQWKDRPAGEHWQVCDHRTACEPACSRFGSAQCAGYWSGSAQRVADAGSHAEPFTHATHLGHTARVKWMLPLWMRTGPVEGQ